MNILRLICIGMTILSTPTLWGMYLARCSVSRAKLTRQACIRYSSHALMTKRGVLQEPTIDYYETALAHKKSLYGKCEDTKQLLNSMHVFIFYYDKKLACLARQKELGSQILERKKLAYRDCAIFYRMYDTNDIFSDIKKLAQLDDQMESLVQWRENMRYAIKLHQNLLAHIQDEQKHLSGALWTLERADFKFDK